MTYLWKLADIAEQAVGRSGSQMPEWLLLLGGPDSRNLQALLDVKNGFYACESALHVFGVGTTPQEYSLEGWNAPDLWRCDYQGSADGMLFFAEDIFGEQFAMKEEGIVRFNPETGACEEVGRNLEAWAEVVFSDLSVQTGYGLAREWQSLHGPLREGVRLVPKMPFAFGGSYEAANLYELEAVKAMKARADLAMQARSWSKGEKVRVRIERTEDA